MKVTSSLMAWGFVTVFICLFVSLEAAERADSSDVEAVTELIEALRMSLDSDYVEPPLEFDQDSPDSPQDKSRRINGRFYNTDMTDLTSAVFRKRHGASQVEEPCEDELPDGRRRVGSVAGTPGVDYPDYKEIPLTSFSCAGRKVPGFYADLETYCQVFHVCYPHRRESFLCPPGTIFNQPILACDYWYSANCSAAAVSVDTDFPIDIVTPETEVDITDLVTVIEAVTTPTPKVEYKPPTSPPFVPLMPKPVHHPKELSSVMKFLPIKAKVTKVLGATASFAGKSPLAVPVNVQPITKFSEHIPGVVSALKSAKLLKPKAKLLAKPLALKAATKAKLLAKAKAKLGMFHGVSHQSKTRLASALLRLLTSDFPDQNRFVYY